MSITPAGATVVRVNVIPVAAVVAFGLAAGCAHGAKRTPTPPPAERPPPVALPPAERTALSPTVYWTSPGKPTPPAEQYRRLTATDCQTLAVRHSGLARVIEREPVSPPGKKAADCEGQAKAVALRHAADEARNRAAGDALDLYYKLVAAEAGTEVTRAAEADLQRLITDAQKAIDAGLKEPPGVTDLESQLADVRAEAARLDGAARELNQALILVLGLAAEPDYRLWPDPPVVRESAIDADEAVKLGLSQRPDLLLIRSILDSPDPSAPLVARQALGAVSPLAGGLPAGLPPGAGLLLTFLAACRGLDGATDEWKAQTMRQLAELLAERERQAEAEIRAGVERVAALAVQARVHAESVDRLRKRVADREKELAAGRDVTAELASARVALRKATGNLVKAATDHQAAVAKLKQAQGLLVRENPAGN